MLHRPLHLCALLVASLALVGLGAPRAAAHDSGSDAVSFVVQGPIDALSCDTTPPTLTVFGLVIDTSGAVFQGSAEMQMDGEDDGNSPAPAVKSCADLAAGQDVRVRLTGDAAPLTATQVETTPSGRVKLLGPIQMVDATAHTLTLYGLSIDASTAVLATGEDDDQGESDDDQGQNAQGQNQSQGHDQPQVPPAPPAPIDLTQLSAGQFVLVRLDPSRLPALVATQIGVLHSGNQVEVDLEDQAGNEVNDDVDSVDVTVDQNAKVTTHATPTGQLKAARVAGAVHIQMKTHGSFVVSGLAQGRAKITVTRTASDGTVTTAHGVAKVKNNKVSKKKLRLKPVRTQ